MSQNQIALSVGGTFGHLRPALEAAKTAKERFFLIGIGLKDSPFLKDIDCEIVSLEGARAFLQLLKSCWQAFITFQKKNPRMDRGAGAGIGGDGGCQPSSERSRRVRSSRAAKLTAKPSTASEGNCLQSPRGPRATRPAMRTQPPKILKMVVFLFLFTLLIDMCL